MPTMPTVAIVGRPNVGKSSLLNALAGRRISIVQDMPGVTRDRIDTPLYVNGKYVSLVDTGGYGFVDEQGLTEHIQRQIESAMDRAQVVLFIVDALEGLTGGDEVVAGLLRRKGIKTIFVANKDDHARQDDMLGDFARVGLGTPLGVSAVNGRNLSRLLELIAENVDLTDAPTTIPPPQLKVAIVGKRNSGKSTLVNAIARLYEGDAERVIVSEIPGTTRDSVDVRFDKDGKSLVVIDTAGVRKKRQMVSNDIEFYSFHRAERSIRRADVVLLLLDSAEPISEPDKKLAGYITEQAKPVVLTINKWDLAREQLIEKARETGGRVDDTGLMAHYRKYVDQELRNLAHAPMLFVTASEGRNVQSLLDTTQNLYRQATTRVGTGVLNRAVRAILAERSPATRQGHRVKVLYVTQIDVQPPTVVLFVNNPDGVDETYRRFMVNRLREALPFTQVPIRLLVRGRSGVEEVDEALGAAGESRASGTATSRKTVGARTGRTGGKAGGSSRSSAGGRAGSSRGGKPVSSRGGKRSSSAVKLAGPSKGETSRGKPPVRRGKSAAKKKGAPNPSSPPRGRKG